jgi:hypothetical protein
MKSLLLACLIFIAPPVAAMSVLPLNLSQLTDQAGRIFVGRCVSVDSELDESGLPSTYARFKVDQGLKGVSAGETVLIKQYGVARGPLKVAEGESAIVPMKTMSLGGGSYRPGSQYLLFLYPESELGFTSPVGGGQGKFEIVAGESSALAVNPLDNRYLQTLRDGPVALSEMILEIQKRLP